MRIAITGTEGRVGRALANDFAARHEVIELPRSRVDLASPTEVDAVADLDFDVLLNPAAVTSLEACEDAPIMARAVNTEAPARLAQRCRMAGRRMIHFSTDYVLCGETEGLHSESARVDPRSVYASTKAAAESAVLEEEGCVIRVSWVYGPEKPAFPDWVVSVARSGADLRAVGDKTSLPCFTRDLVKWTDSVMAAGCPGEVFHACQGGPPTSWHGIAEWVVSHLERSKVIPEHLPVIFQRLEDMIAFRAVRPRHTAMSTDRLSNLHGCPPRDWREAMTEYLDAFLISR
ncbi:MAG: SDR family oxidoreductase [Verrucomicrobiales bacterium]